MHGGACDVADPLTPFRDAADPLHQVLDASVIDVLAEGGVMKSFVMLHRPTSQMHVSVGSGRKVGTL